MNNNEFMITTFDNPFDPFYQFDEWLLFDNMKGYNTCGHLARLVEIRDDLTDKEIDSLICEGIDFMIENDPLNIYKKGWKDAKTPEGIEPVAMES